MQKLDLSIIFTRLIDPIVTLILYTMGFAFCALFLFFLYMIVRLRYNPFRKSYRKFINLINMEIKFKLLDFIRWLIVDMVYARRNKRFFNQFGLTAYCGRQGAGKTISMIEYANRIHEKYPDCIIVSNFYYKHADRTMTDWKDFMNIRNSIRGVLFLIDEIHSEYSSADWKDFPESLLSEISQQRKQRIKICVTAQVFSRIVKPIREQTFSVVQCRTFANRWTFTKEYDALNYEMFCENPDSKKLQVLWKRSFVQSNTLRKCYDTYEKIKRMNKIANSKSGFIPRNERMNVN